jgi:hypothetical protein
MNHMYEEIQYKYLARTMGNGSKGLYSGVKEKLTQDCNRPILQKNKKDCNSHDLKQKKETVHTSMFKILHYKVE